MRRRDAAILVAAAAALAPAGAGPAAAAERDAFADAAARAIPAVVRVESREPALASQSAPALTPWRDDAIPELPAGLARLLPGEVETASGVVITPDGYVLTAGSLFRDAGRRPRVVFPDGRRIEAVFIGRDAELDVALLKVPGRDFPHVEFGDSDKVRAGAFVLAVGDPFGVGLDGQPSVSAGIVSAVRPVRCDDSRWKGPLIETDAAINPGVHGGALVDLEGKLVGLCAPLLRSRSTDCLVGCAIPANVLRERLPRLRLESRPYLGVLLREEDATTDGALVEGIVPGSPAAEAGIERGDVIVGFGARAVGDARALIGAIDGSRAGDGIVIRVRRGGETIALRAVLARRDF